MDPRAGGPPSSARNIWVAAARAGLSVSAAFGRNAPLSGGEAARIEDLIAEGIEVQSFPLAGAGGGLAGRWGISFALAGWLLRHAGDFDVIQLHGSWTFSTLTGALAGRVRRRKVVLFPHESLSRFDQEKGSFLLKSVLKGLIRRLLLAAIDEIVFSSPLEKQDSRAAGQVLFHPVFDERHAPPALVPSPGDGLRIGYLGRLDSKKNIEMLIDCLATDSSLRLTVAGDGSPAYRDVLRSRAEASGVAPRVTWLGFIAAADRPDFFAGIDLLALPSAYECFGMAAAEAMCFGRPVLVSRQTGIAELVERHGAGKVVSAVPDEIGAALRAMTEDLPCLARGARALAEKELSLGHYGDRLAHLYRGLVGDHV
jgi:glycosyltransferase involved in cell wall biosynthesis